MPAIRTLAARTLARGTPNQEGLRSNIEEAREEEAREEEAREEEAREEEAREEDARKGRLYM